MFSNLGATIQSVAAAWLMTELTDSNQLIALVQASAMLPIMLFGMIAGAIADNFDRRRVMLAAQVGMLVTSSALALLTYLGLVGPFLLLAFTLSVGAGTALNAPAWQSSVRLTVPARELPQAIALNAMSFNTARSVGPAIGGLLISVWDISLAFAINALSYSALIIVLLWWKPEIRKVERRPIFPAIAVGLRYCMTTIPIRNLLVRGTFMGFCVAAYQALLPAITEGRLGGSELDFGILLAIFGVGSIVAVPFIAKARRRLELEGVLLASAIMYVIAMVAVAQVNVFIYALPAAFLAGVGWVVFLTTLNTAMQLRAPDEILGRCMSIYQASTFGGLALGAWAWGALADLANLAFALQSAAVLLIGGSLILKRFVPVPRHGEGIIRNW